MTLLFSTRNQSTLKNRRTPPRPLIIAAAFLIIYYIRQRTVKINTPSLQTTTSPMHKQQELLQVYEFPPSSFPNNEPPHLTPIDPSTLLPKSTHPIDIAHRNGYLHTGHVLYVMDASGSLLFLQRSAEVVTCPATWSMLGEHSNVGENSMETVVRGLEEELGFVALGFEKSDFPGAWTVELHPHYNRKESVRVTIQNATEFPLYYIRHYGPRNDNRIDRQLTYLWIVTFPKKHEEIQWKLDDEVADHKWVPLDEVAAWLSEDATKNKKVFKSEGGVKDDGPDEGDFCHRTIRLLYEVGLMNMI